MFANLIQLITGHPPAAERYDHAFVKSVSVHSAAQRDVRTSRVVLACWLLIAAKCWLISWLIWKFRVPIDPMWVIAPTILFALLATVVYFLNE